MNIIAKITHFVTVDVWRLRLKDLSRPKSFLIKHLRVILLTLRGFDEDKCQLWASALTFYTLLSIVPILAMAFGIAKGFGLERNLERQLLDRFPGQEEVFLRIVEFAQKLLVETRGGLIAGIGVALLIWTVIRVLSNVESSFNHIWGIKEQRTLGRKFSDYLFIMFISPILLVISSSLTVFITTQVTFITQKVAFLSFFNPFIYFSLNVLPYAIMWGLFTFIYIFIPNTKVNIVSGLLAGVIAGTLYQATQFAYITFQLGVAQYNAIYGSFAALPLFLVWLQISWFIVLFGAEISFAHQNVLTYEFEPDSLKASLAFRRMLALRVMQYLIARFSRAEPPATSERISHDLEIPIRLLRQIVFELSACNLISETRTRAEKESAYQPGRDTDALTVASVLEALQRQGVDTVPVKQDEELKKISRALDELRQAVERSPSNKRIKDL